MLSGWKTYIVAALMVVNQLYGYFFAGAPLDLNAILAALGLGALRAGVSKGSDAP